MEKALCNLCQNEIKSNKDFVLDFTESFIPKPSHKECLKKYINKKPAPYLPARLEFFIRNPITTLIIFVIIVPLLLIALTKFIYQNLIYSVVSIILLIFIVTYTIILFLYHFKYTSKIKK